MTAPAGRRDREAPPERAESRRHPPADSGDDRRSFRLDPRAPPEATPGRSAESPRRRPPTGARGSLGCDSRRRRTGGRTPAPEQGGRGRPRAGEGRGVAIRRVGGAVAPPAGGESTDAAASPAPTISLPPGRAGRRRRGARSAAGRFGGAIARRPSRSPSAWPESGAWTRRGWRKGGRRVVRIPRRRAAGLPPKALRRPAELRKGEEIWASRGPRGQVDGHSVASPQHCSQKTPRGRRIRRFAIEAGAAVSMFGPTGADRSPRVGGRNSGSRHKPTNRFVQRSQPTRTSPVSGSESGSCQDEMMEIQR